MFKILQPVQLYIGIYKNRFEVLDLSSNERFISSNHFNFSSNRLAIADFLQAEKALRSAVSPLIKQHKKIGFISPTLTLVFQQFDLVEGGLSDVEKRALRDLGEHLGGRYIYITDSTRPLTPTESLCILAGK